LFIHSPSQPFRNAASPATASPALDEHRFYSGDEHGPSLLHPHPQALQLQLQLQLQLRLRTKSGLETLFD
jgi:hypothetical protein